MADIPTVYVKLKDVDYDREILACLGHGYRRGSFVFAPPSLGVWSLWEILDSPIIKSDPTATTGDYMRLLFVNAQRRAAVDLIGRWIDAGKPAVRHAEHTEWSDMCELDAAAVKWWAGIDGQIDIDLIKSVNRQIELCFTGYEMFPRNAKTGASCPYAYAGEAYGAICSLDPANADRLIWDTPLCLVGHIMAAKAIMGGSDKIARPPDEEDLRKQRREADDRESRGELHEWQIKCPIAFPLSAKQQQFPHLVDQWSNLVKEQKLKMGVKDA